MELAVIVLEVIQFLLAERSPEIIAAVEVVEVVAFHPFTYQEIFPQPSNILAQFQGPEVAYNGISNAVIVEIHLAGLFQLRMEVAAESL